MIPGAACKFSHYPNRQRNQSLPPLPIVTLLPNVRAPPQLIHHRSEVVLAHIDQHVHIQFIVLDRPVQNIPEPDEKARQLEHGFGCIYLPHNVPVVELEELGVYVRVVEIEKGTKETPFEGSRLSEVSAVAC